MLVVVIWLSCHIGLYIGRQCDSVVCSSDYSYTACLSAWICSYLAPALQWSLRLINWTIIYTRLDLIDWRSAKRGMIHAARGPSNRADRLGRWRRAGGAKRNGSENWAEKNRTGQKAALEACCIVARQNPTKDSSHTARLCKGVDCLHYITCCIYCIVGLSMAGISVNWSFIIVLCCI